MRSILVLSYRFFFIVSFFISTSSGQAEGPQTYTFHGYAINLTKGDKTKNIPASDKIQILQGQKIIDEIEDHLLEVVMLGFLKFKGDPLVKPYLLIGGYSGGAHCCSSVHVYEFAPQLKKAFKYEGDGGIRLQMTIPENEYFIKVTDPSFLYWHASYADSANIPIYFKKGPKGLEPCEECQQENINEKEILALAKTLYEESELWNTLSFADEPYYPGKVVQEVVILLYNNNPTLAAKFLETAWNPKNPYKEQFKKDLVALLKENPYWQYLEKRGYSIKILYSDSVIDLNNF